MKMNPALDDTPIPIMQIAKELRISDRKVRDFCSRGKINSVKMGKHWVITRADLEEFKKTEDYKKLCRENTGQS